MTTLLLYYNFAHLEGTGQIAELLRNSSELYKDSIGKEIGNITHVFGTPQPCK